MFIITLFCFLLYFLNRIQITFDRFTFNSYFNKNTIHKLRCVFFVFSLFSVNKYRVAQKYQTGINSFKIYEENSPNIFMVFKMVCSPVLYTWLQLTVSYIVMKIKSGGVIVVRAPSGARTTSLN